MMIFNYFYKLNGIKMSKYKNQNRKLRKIKHKSNK